METLKEVRTPQGLLRLVKHRDRFHGLLIVAGKIAINLDGVDRDEVWARLEREAPTSRPNFFGYDGARARFLRIFPDGFSSPEYAAEERDYKLAAKQRLDDTVPLESATEGSGLGEAILAVFRATNLLSSFESMRMQDVLRSEEADAFIRGAARFTLGDLGSGLTLMEHALKPHEAAKWTTISYLPYLWRPDQHIFLKPTVTREFAERVGHGFADTYSPKLDVAVYGSLLDLANTTQAEIAALEPRDFIDVQSFIWVVGEYDTSREEPDPISPLARDA